MPQFAVWKVTIWAIIATFRAGAGADRERHAAEERGHGGHHDRAKPQEARLVNGLLR